MTFSPNGGHSAVRLYTSDLLTITRNGRFLLAELHRPHRVLSTSMVGGGMREDCRYVLNHQSCEPVGDDAAMRAWRLHGREGSHRLACQAAGVDPLVTALAGTAANMQCAGLSEVSHAELTVVAVTTAGVEANATRAGDPAGWHENPTGSERVSPSPHPGTIVNLVFINQPCTPGCLTKAASMLTEAKTTVLLDLRVASRQSARLATGTGTDQFAISAPLVRGNGWERCFSGSHNTLGQILAEAVRASTARALELQNGLVPSMRRDVLAALGRHGLTEDLLRTVAMAELGPSQAEFLLKNRNPLLHDPATAATAYGLAEVLDGAAAGMLSLLTLSEAIANHGAQLGTVVAHKPERYAVYRSRLLALGRDAAESAAHALVWGFAEKWIEDGVRSLVLSLPDPKGDGASLSNPERPAFLPLAVDVKDRLCVVVGGGSVAFGKARTLLDHGARVRLVVPPSERLTAGDDLGVEVVRHECEVEDLSGARLVIAATNDPGANGRVAGMARGEGILTLLVDRPEESDLHFPAVLRVGELTVAYSTNGSSPAFAARLRDEAAAFYGRAHAEFCRLARSLRSEAMTSLPRESRERLFRQLADSDVFSLLERGDPQLAAERARAVLGLARSGITATAGLTDHRTPAGKVFLVGAGPGDPGLCTIKGARCLGAADAVLYDSTIDPRLLELCPSRAARLDVGKRKGCHGTTQEAIIATLVEQARLGRVVVRLKGGDPLVFGRGGEEARALAKADVPFEIVPGVSSVTAVPAYAGIPVTDRECSSSFAAYSAHRKGGLSFTDAEWKRIAEGPDTLVFLMGKTRCDLITQKLVAFGRPGSTPAALIFDGTTHRQQTVVGTLETIANEAHKLEVSGPGLIVIGEVVNARREMAWFGVADTSRDLGLRESAVCPVE